VKTFPLPSEVGSYSNLPGWKRYGLVGMKEWYNEDEPPDRPVIHVDSVVAGYVEWQKQGRAAQGQRTDLHRGVRIEDVHCPTIIDPNTPTAHPGDPPPPPPRGGIPLSTGTERRKK
jgi:hypothetical protein